MARHERFVPAGLVATVLAAFLASSAAASAAAARITIDEADRVRAGTVPEGARLHRDVGPAPADLPLERITLALFPRAGAAAELDALLEAQQDPASPEYHRWVTPEEFGRRFGASDEAIGAVLDWLQAHGLAVDDVAAGRQWIHLSGTAGQVAEAFGSPIHEFEADGVLRHANVAPPTIPRALAGIVRGVLSLHDFPRRHARLARRAETRFPDVNFEGGDHGIGPADFAVLYNVAPLYRSGIDGSGVSIAVVGRTDIRLSDVQSFRSFFGLPSNDPVFVHNGADPGNLGDNGSSDGQLEESEADLDVEWAGAIAPRAAIKFVISKSTSASDAADLSAQYAVDKDIAPILSSSFGLCEHDLGSGNDFYAGLWEQAAAEGITVFVPSGDSGAAGCDDPTGSRGTVRAVSGLCSTPYDVCVGGTQLDDADAARWWSAAEDPSTRESLMSYVPESVWNESGAASGGSGLFATGGGPSAVHAKPSWQRAPGVPNDGRRDTPDVSLNAAAHDGYVVFQRYDPASGTVYLVSGTSASTVAFAGLMALVVQSQGAPQGNANPVLYRIASAQLAAGTARPFHDVVSGDNGVPGATGFSAGPGYDLATGLGSVDATALVFAWTGEGSRRGRVVPAPRPAPARVKPLP